MWISFLSLKLDNFIQKMMKKVYSLVDDKESILEM